MAFPRASAVTAHFSAFPCTYRQVVDVLWVLQSVERAPTIHHPAQRTGIVQQRAGPQVVAVKGLAVVVGHEEGPLIGLQQGCNP